MIGSPDLFRSWKDVGTDGLDEVERFARAELRDGSWTWLRPTAATPTVREPTLVRRLASALHFRRARASLPAPAQAAGIRSGLAAVHFAGESAARLGPHAHPAGSAVLLAACPEECEPLHAECNEP